MKSKRFKNYSDSQLIKEYQLGNESCLNELLERYRRPLVHYLVYLVQDKDQAEDLCQETLIKIFLCFQQNQYVDNCKFFSWAKRVAKNMMIDSFRKNNKRSATQTVSLEPKHGNATAVESAETTIIKSEMERKVQVCIEKLPVQQRNIVQLRFYEETPFKEIAQKTDVSINTALGRMRYALANLHKMLHNKNVV